MSDRSHKRRRTIREIIHELFLVKPDGFFAWDFDQFEKLAKDLSCYLINKESRELTKDQARQMVKDLSWHLVKDLHWQVMRNKIDEYGGKTVYEKILQYKGIKTPESYTQPEGKKIATLDMWFFCLCLIKLKNSVELKNKFETFKGKKLDDALWLEEFIIPLILEESDLLISTSISDKNINCVDTPMESTSTGDEFYPVEMLLPGVPHESLSEEEPLETDKNPRIHDLDNMCMKLYSFVMSDEIKTEIGKKHKAMLFYCISYPYKWTLVYDEYQKLYPGQYAKFKSMQASVNKSIDSLMELIPVKIKKELRLDIELSKSERNELFRAAICYAYRSIDGSDDFMQSHLCIDDNRSKSRDTGISSGEMVLTMPQ